MPVCDLQLLPRCVNLYDFVRSADLESEILCDVYAYSNGQIDRGLSELSFLTTMW